MALARDQIQALKDAVGRALADDCAAVGLRSITEFTECEVGQTLPPSYRWVDGESTGELLLGVCALEVASASDVGRLAAVLTDTYWPTRIAVVGSDHRPVRGEDEGEVILIDARVYAVEAMAPADVWRPR